MRNAMKMYFSQSSRENRALSEKEIERNALLSDLEKTKRALELPTPVSTMWLSQI